MIRIWFITVSALLFSCTKDKGIPNYSESGYPSAIADIMVNKCATAGCHTEKDKEAAAGVDLSRWSSLFSERNTGAIVIPYRPDFSSLCFAVNTNSLLGPVLAPTMPLNSASLNEDQIYAIQNWVANGAPDNKGFVKFSDNDSRKKIYVTNELCDVVTVFDSETLMPMRYVDVGKLPSQEFLFDLKVSPDGNNWYVSFFSSSGLIQKFNAKTDQPQSELNLGPGPWSTFDITSDSKYGFFVNSSSEGKIVLVDLAEMKTISTYTGNFVYPRGIVVNNGHNKLYVGTEAGNFIYVIDISDKFSPVITEKPIDGSQIVSHEQSLDPTLFCKTSDNKFCFIGCGYNNQVRIMDMQTDSVTAVFNLPAAPQQMDAYEESGLLFVACPEDITSFPGKKGSVFIIDYKAAKIIKIVNTGFQPYGLGVDRLRKVVAVANSNLDSQGPGPHHSTSCKGRNGYVTFIDLKTLELIPDKKIEVAVFPRFISVRR
jgi:DNA-binding beta-propeller fold protein YncE